MNARKQRGLIIAATCRLNRKPDGTWVVPSQTSKDTVAYQVNLETKACTCLDCTEGGYVCKHYYAAMIVHRRDVLPDGTMVETKTVTLTEKKVFKQSWPQYNVAQQTEKRRLQVLLRDLCRNLALGVLSWNNLAVGTEGVTIAFLLSPALALVGLGVSAAVGVLAGMVPAWQAARAEIVASLRAV